MSKASASLSGAAAIVGIGATEFSKASGRSELQLSVEAVRAALADCGLGVDDVGGLGGRMFVFAAHGRTPSSAAFTGPLSWLILRICLSKIRAGTRRRSILMRPAPEPAG